MIKAKNFINELKRLNVDFFSGVPDSLMSEFSKSLHFDFNDENHIIRQTILGVRESAEYAEEEEESPVADEAAKETTSGGDD